ncbi:TAP-like protein-domain-containing protein [Echria macrotheca]|uniref:TAP-like protein-domain-containing protein n=1 Tax=Echria macrotheca TaxID=438768 RepID=A0AAJ0F187_9PEZI|nr:TAP-like protein-domain-containing protein [Echria macrotheca]
MNPWDDITPSTKLQWTPCYEKVFPALHIQCARLAVPLDYSNPLSGPQVAIAMVLIPAKNMSVAKQPLLINPGGPGGSGVLAGLSLGPAIQTIVGEDRAVIGFDPRGVGYTTPQADCWATPPSEGCGSGSDDGDGDGECEGDVYKGFAHRVEWLSQNAAFGGVNSSNVAVKFLDAGERAVNRLCTEQDRVRGGKSVLGFAATENVARDMVRIVERWDEWVDDMQREGTETKREMRGKLVYWGFSYGTYLGATFARMFPERVGRVMLDGVVDADYYVSDMWDESLADADRVLDAFFRGCAEVGKECAFYREGDDADTIKARYDGVLQKLDDYPITFTHPEHFYPVVLRREFLHQLTFMTLYSPTRGFIGLARLLDILAEGEYSTLGPMFADLQIYCRLPGTKATRAGYEAQRAIMCGDKTKPVNLTIPEIWEHFDTMTAFSRFGDIWTQLLLQCDGWDIYPPRSESVPAWGGDKTPIETAFPVLFLSNTFDPVTPLRAAVKMALRFKDAGLLEQHAEGHCTIAVVSRCTAKVVRDYLIHGKVPPAPVVKGDGFTEGEWMTCEADERPWRGVSGMDVDEEDEKLVEALQTVRDVMGAMPRGGPAMEEVKGVSEGVLKLLR